MLFCLKCILYIINLIIWSIGACILGIGIWIRTDPHYFIYKDGMDEVRMEVLPLSYLAIAIGASLVILGVFGCCGIACNNICILCVYSAVLIVLFVAEIIAAALILLGSSNNQLKTLIQSQIGKSIEARKINNVGNDILDYVQKNLECCGAKDYKDYEVDKRPKSCYDEKTNKLFEQGCEDKLVNYIKEKLGIMAGMSISLAIIQVGALVFLACIIIKARSAMKGII